MNTHEQRIREFAYQIWESEGKPHGHTERHWEMARTLAETHAASVQQVAGSTEPAPSVEPITPISPTQPAQPVPVSDPIQPTDPVQPSQPNALQDDAEVAKPVKAKRLRTKAVDKTAPAETASAPIIAEQTKKPGRLRKAKNQENEPA